MRDDAGDHRTAAGDVGNQHHRFGTYHYRYASGHEGDAPLAGFSPRRQHLAIYLVGGFGNRYQSVLARLGPHKTGKGCLYLKRLDDVDHDALRELIDRSARVHKSYRPSSHLAPLASCRAAFAVQETPNWRNGRRGAAGSRSGGDEQRGECTGCRGAVPPHRRQTAV